MSVNSKMTAIADAIRNLMDISGTMGLDAMASNISSITKRGAVTGTILTKSDQYIIPAGYHNGNGSVGIDDDEQAKIIPENIKNGVTILGVSGTASGDIYAIISVTYPVGSICTCTDGTTTLTAKDTSGYALFNVKAGTYTVECHTGDNSQSKSTSVTVADGDAGKSIPVALSYELLLFSGGAVVPWSTYDQNSGNVTIGSTISFGTTHVYKAAYTKNKIDVTNYNTLYCVGAVTDIPYYDNRKPRICIANSPITDTTSDYGVAHTLLTKDETIFSLDVSSFTGEYYVEVWGVAALSLTDVKLQ